MASIGSHSIHIGHGQRDHSKAPLVQRWTSNLHSHFNSLLIGLRGSRIQIFTGLSSLTESVLLHREELRFGSAVSHF